MDKAREYAAEVEEINAELKRITPFKTLGMTIENMYVKNTIMHGEIRLDDDLSDKDPLLFFAEVDHVLREPSVEDCRFFTAVKKQFKELERFEVNYTFKDVTRSYTLEYNIS